MCPLSPALQEDSSPTEPPGKPQEGAGEGGFVTKLCLTLCDPMACSPPGSSVHGIFQARILEWVVISFSQEDPIEKQMI